MTKDKTQISHMSDHSIWQGEITNALEAMNMTCLDAQALLEGQKFSETQAWSMGLSPVEAAKKILIAETPSLQFGLLAKEFCGKDIPLSILESRKGYYIGTFTSDGPCSRESIEYFSTEVLADTALNNGRWHQREEP